MKKKSGFTLAEVLITLGIIGVVAALTAPALVKNSGQAKIGPALAKFVNTFETGCEQMLTENNESKMTNANIPALASYIIMTPYDAARTYTFYDATGTNSYNVSNKAFHDMGEDCINKIESGVITQDEYAECNFNYEIMQAGDTSIAQLKDGSVMVVIPWARNDNKGVGAYKGALAEVLIDIDGDKPVNKIGKDVFGFILDKTGVLVPAGSKAHKYLNDNDGKSGANLYIGYTDKCSVTGTNIAEALACTGRIADNAWKADY